MTGLVDSSTEGGNERRVRPSRHWQAPRLTIVQRARRVKESTAMMIP